MIAWTIPAAFAGLLLLAGPVAAHMLLRRHAVRVRFPTVRFLATTRAAAVRVRRPSDIALLCLRLAIVLAAVLAAAQPVLTTAWRMRAWNQRMIRAVIVDTSRSVASDVAAQLAAGQADAFMSARFTNEDIGVALEQAAAWFATTPPARREVVVISDFQRGSLRAGSLAALPADVGVRFVRAGAPHASRETELPRISGWRGSGWTPRIALDADRLDAWWTRTAPEPLSWLTTREAPAEASAARRAVAGAASFGVPGGDASRRVIVQFSGADVPRGQPLRAPWMLRAAAALRESSLLAGSGVALETADEGGALAVRANVSAASVAAPAVVRAVMLAVRPVALADRELETATLSDADLAAWRRDAAPIASTDRVRAADGTDSRWLWAGALALLLIEALIRRPRTRAAVRDVHADAA